MVLVSVLLPSYNHEKFISETIDSVLAQTFKDFEFIIIDDFSRDRSKEIIKEYKEKDNRIKFLFHNENIGISKTENELLNMAKGKYIAFLNSDDVWDKKKLEKQLKVLESNENLIIWTEGEIIDRNSKPIGTKFTEKYSASRKKKSGNIFEELLYDNFIFFASLMFKKENLGDLRFNEKFNIINDYQLEVALAKKYDYFFISEPLAKYRVHEYNTIYSENQVPIIKEYILIFKLFLEKYSENIPNKIKLYLYQKFIDLSISLANKIEIRSKSYNPFKIDPFRFIYKIKNKNIKNILLKKQKQRIFISLNRFLLKSLKKFIVALSMVIRFKKVSRNLNFWINLTLFLVIMRKNKITQKKGSRFNKIFTYLL